VEVRIPLPFRRHALGPFADAATMADDGEDAFSNFRLATGLVYAFSFFRERLEGFVYGAMPMVSDPSEEYVGIGVDGSF